MKKIIIGSLACVALLYATNGDNLIGLGAKSRAMGGVGIATYFGAENTLSNPALTVNTVTGSMEVEHSEISMAFSMRYGF